MESPKQSEMESVEYWMKRAKCYEQKVTDVQQELDEYTENSAQLEKELEASLEQTEKQNRDLEHQNQLLKNEIEMLMNKLKRSQKETNVLEDELQALKQDKERQAVYIRELEQKNDDLERGQRVISESVSCIETLLNQAYERNAVLESEVDEVENLRVKLQRAADETKDLKLELKIKDKVHRKEDDSAEGIPVSNGHQARTLVEIETQTPHISPHKREINGNAMTPSSKVTAINIVGDILRKVGLERFLCRECGKVKCGCEPSAAAPAPPAAAATSSTHEPVANTDDIQYRNTRHISRQLSSPGPENGDCKKPPHLASRASEHPFVRSPQGESGKLRRSFAVRSREGLENLLSFASIRKGPEHGRSKSPKL